MLDTSGGSNNVVCEQGQFAQTATHTAYAGHVQAAGDVRPRVQPTWVRTRGVLIGRAVLQVWAPTRVHHNNTPSRLEIKMGDYNHQSVYPGARNT